MTRWPVKDVSSWLGNSTPVAMRHYAMATDEAIQAAANPDGQTVTRNAKTDTPESGSNCGSISCISGAIGRNADDTTGAILDDETEHFIIQNSAGDYYLVGLAGLEPAT